MAGTTDRGYPYPDGSDPVTLALYIRQLAQAVNDDVETFSPLLLQVQRTGAGQSVPDNTATTISGFGTTNFTEGVGVPTYSVGVFTIVTAGIYEVRLFVSWPAISAAHRTVLTLLHNGASIPGGLDTRWYPSGTASPSHQSVAVACSCAVGDVLSQQALQDSGSTQTTYAGASPVFSVRRIG